MLTNGAGDDRGKVGINRWNLSESLHSKLLNTDPSCSRGNLQPS